MHLITLIGPPAVGKHTIGKLLAERTGYKLFHNHLTVDLSLSLFDYGSDGFFPLMSNLRLVCFKTAAASKLTGLIFTCAFAFPDAETFATEVDRIVEEHRGRNDIIRLTCTTDDLRQRVNNVERHQFGKITDPEILTSAIERFNLLDAIPGRGALTINTSEMNPQQACDRICKKLGVGNSI